MAEFDYKQRPATEAYRSGWDHAFGGDPCAISPLSPKPAPESPTTVVDGSGQWLSPLDGDTCLPSSLAKYPDALEGINTTPVVQITPETTPLSSLQHGLVCVSWFVVFTIGACAFCGSAY